MVIKAEVLGMCFGVRDALQVIESLDRPQDVTIHGELVHNEAVLTQLRFRGFGMVGEQDRQRVPDKPTVLITAHGISDRERRRLEAAGRNLVDTTCPLVARVHRAAQMLQAEGFHVLVIGRRDHVEVQGIIEDLQHFEVIQTVVEVRTFSARRLGIVCQTTAPARQVEEIRAAVRAKNPLAEIRFIDTVCQPTKEHQRALERLLGQVDAMVVVGGKNSNNTRELVALCLQRQVRAFHVQGAGDLRREWFRGCQTVGLTAGTSTLDSTIDAVHEALLRMNPGETL